MRAGQGLSINTIMIAAIALVVLVVLIAFVLGWNDAVGQEDVQEVSCWFHYERVEYLAADYSCDALLFALEHGRVIQKWVEYGDVVCGGVVQKTNQTRGQYFDWHELNDAYWTSCLANGGYSGTPRFIRGGRRNGTMVLS